MFIDEWESYVKKVVILGDPARMENMAGEWDVLLRRLSTVADSLRHGARGLEDRFQGAAGDAHRQRLASIISQIEQLDTEHRPIADLLRTSAQELATAKSAMPIPISALAEVHHLQAAVIAANPLNGYGYIAAAGLSSFSLQSQVVDAALDVLTDDTGEARNVVQRLNQNQQTAIDRTTDPTGSRQHVETGQHAIAPPGGQSTAGSPIGSSPGVRGGGGFDPSGAPNGGSSSRFDPLHDSTPLGSGRGSTDAGDSGPLGSAAFDPDGWTRSGLAGAGDGGFQAAGGLGAGQGIGSLGTSGGAAGALGAAGGVGPAGAGLGSAAGGLGTVMGGAGSVAGRGSWMAGVPMMGGGAGAAGSSENERSTWLEEDEDVWGVNEEPSMPQSLGWAP